MSAPYDECVQVIRSQEHAWVRDSKNPLGSVLGFTREVWAAFLVGVQCDEFEGGALVTLSLAVRDVPSPRKKEYGMVEVPQPPLRGAGLMPAPGRS